MSESRSDGAPDFERLYGAKPLTAGMAARLWTVATLISDAFADDMGEIWLEDLPVVAKRYADEAFVAAFAARFEILAERIAGGLQEMTDVATCTADEIALHMIIDRAGELENEGFFDEGWIDALDRRPKDTDFVGIKDTLFEDLDALFLFDPALDGVEDPDSEAYQIEGFANLHPRDWFKTFENKQHVDRPAE